MNRLSSLRICVVVFAFFTTTETGLDAQVNATTNTPTVKRHQYKLVDLGTFGGSSSVIFGATGPLNNLGEVTSCADTTTPDSYAPNGNPYFGGDPLVQHAFYWSHGVLHDLKPFPGGRGSCGQWINDLGVVVGAAEDGSIDPSAGYPAVVATAWIDGKAFALGSLGGSESIGWAINNRGQIAGTAATDIADPYAGAIFQGANAAHAFLWQKASLKDLGTLGGSTSQGFYINDRGEVAGLSYIDDVVNPNTGTPDVHPFLWKDGRMIDLGSLGGGSGFPNAVNNRS